MSDPTRASRDDLETLLAEAHRSAAPPSPDAEALARVRAHAQQLAEERGPGGGTLLRRSAVWRGAVVTASALVVLGLSLIVFNRPADVAFARDKLLAVLAPSGTVLHYVEQRDSSFVAELLGQGGETRLEYWIDAEYETLRREEIGADGQLLSVRVESDARQRNVMAVQEFGADGEPVEKSTPSDTQWHLIEVPASWSGDPAEPAEFNPFLWLDQMRAAVANGEAKVVGTTTVDGDRCWEIEWVYDSSAEASDPSDATNTRAVFTAVVRQSDYRPIRTSSVIEQNGRETERFEHELTLWEVLPRGEVDPSLFDRHAVGADAAFDNRIYTPEDLSDFREYDAWWLGPEFEGKTLTGTSVTGEDGTESAGEEVTYNRITDGVGQLPFPNAGELVATYSRAAIDEGRRDDVRVVCSAQATDPLEEVLALMPRASSDPGVWREAGGRRYLEYAEQAGGAAGSRALLNLGDATLLVITPDSETTARAVAALVKAN